MSQLFRILDLQQGPRSNEAMNRYWVDNPAGTELSLLAVAQVFANDHVDLVRTAQSDEWEHIALFVEDVLTGLSLLVDLIDFVGERSGDPVPASNAYSFPLKPIGPVLKRGGKRIPGVREGDTNDEVVDNAGFLGVLDGLALSMWLPFQISGVTCPMSVVRPIGDPVTSYLVSHLAGGIYRQIGTQVSRKLSRGGGTALSRLVPHTRTSYTSIASYGGTADADYATYIAAKAAARVALGHTPVEVTRTIS